MPQSKILIDTNAYLRLAHSIRPLLFEVFGDLDYCLYVIPEVNDELERRRLKNKFPWVHEAEYVAERKYFPTVSKKQKQEIDNTFDFIWNYVQEELPGPSKVDALYIAYGLELDIPVVTDDYDMRDLGHEFGCKMLKTLDILKLMLECGHISFDKVKSLIRYWLHIGDSPGNLKKDFREVFGEPPFW